MLDHQGMPSTTPMMVTLDFRSLGVTDRFTVAETLPARHVPLQPPAGLRQDLPAYLSALLDDAPLELESPVVIACYCGAFGLVEPLIKALWERGHVVREVVAFDPVLLTQADVRGAYTDILRQTNVAESAIDASAERLALGRADDIDHWLGTQVTVGMGTIRTAVAETLGVTGPNDPAAAIADQLASRYQNWLQHLLACYAGSLARGDADPIDTSTITMRATWSAGRELSVPRARWHATRQAAGDVFTSGAAAEDLLAAIHRVEKPSGDESIRWS